LSAKMVNTAWKYSEMRPHSYDCSLGLMVFRACKGQDKWAILHIFHLKMPKVVNLRSSVWAQIPMKLPQSIYDYGRICKSFRVVFTIFCIHDNSTNSIFQKRPTCFIAAWWNKYDGSNGLERHEIGESLGIEQ
jgi:hypothetical protein